MIVKAMATGFLLLAVVGSVSSCVESEAGTEPADDDGDGINGTGSGTAPTEGASLTTCAPRGVPAPVDVSASFNSLDCLRASFDKIESVLPVDAQGTFDGLDGSILFTSGCIDVDTPAGMTFVTGVAIERDDTGADPSRHLKIPLPSADDVAEATGANRLLVTLPKVDVPTNLAVFVAKVTSFKGEKLFKLVNLAVLREEDGKRFLEIGIDDPASPVTAGLGPGLYGLFVSTKPMGVVSGTVTLDGAPTGDAIVVGTEAPFLSVADDEGRFLIANVQGQGGIAGYHLPTGGHGELMFPLQKPGEVNPKTGEPVEIPGSDASLPGIETLNLKGVTLAMSSEEAPVAMDNLDFETGDFTAWNAAGDVSVLTDRITELFPDTTEVQYAIVSSGAGSLGQTVSFMSRDFDVPRTSTKLKVEYNFVSQEYPAWVDSQFNDTFYILIGGDKVFLHKESVNNNAGKWKDFYTALGNVDQSAAETTNVLHVFGGTTGARVAEFDISRCTGQKTRLIFGVSDMGDSIYDTAALINRVWFE